jgi:hypothetical protein
MDKMESRNVRERQGLYDQGQRAKSYCSTTWTV